MERKTALTGAAVMTGIIALAFLILGASADGRPKTNMTPPPVEPVADSLIVPVMAESDAAFAAREAALLDQIDLRKAAINDVDATYKAQLDALAQRLEETNQSLLDAAENIGSLQKENEQIQTEIMAADQAFQVEMNGLQAKLTSEDAQIRRQLEPIYAQLQLAYDQIAAQQASAAQAVSGGNSQTNPPSGQDDHHGDDHHDGDHDDDHGDDGHDEHDDD